MADCLDWLIEHVPDGDDTFMRAHSDHFRRGDLLPGVFKVRDDGMSVDWAKYSTPEETRKRGREPLENAVVSLPVLKVRAISGLDVKHAPENPPKPPNRAHSNVVGIPASGVELTKTRLLLLDASSILIAL
jgi:hypothetical protein